MPTTITTYHTFVAGNKARASEVNTNFSNHRGTLLPINTDTQTASNNTHDLGSSEHLWRNIYLQNSPIVGGAALGQVMPIEACYYTTAPADWATVGRDHVAIKFLADTDTSIAFNVPLSSHSAPQAISLICAGYSDTTVAAYFKLETTLHRTNSTVLPSLPSNVYTSTASFTFTTTGTMFRNASLLLCPTTSVIGTATLAGGNLDFLSCRLTRMGTDTNDTGTGSVFVMDLSVNFGG